MFTRLLFASVLAASVFQAQAPQDESVEFARRTTTSAKTFVPASGYVPDSETAIAVAIAVLTPIYGKTTIGSEKPWHAGLKDGIWTVVGTFNGKGLGGEAIIQID